MVQNKIGRIAIGQGIKAFGFVIIAIDGGYSSLTKDFKIGSLLIAIGALVVAVGEFFL